MWEDYLNYLGKRVERFPGIGPSPTFWSLMVSLGAVMAPLVVLFSLLMCYDDHILRIKA